MTICQAAHAGCQQAMHQLGVMHYLGAESDDATGEAVRWFRMARPHAHSHGWLGMHMHVLQHMHPAVLGRLHTHTSHGTRMHAYVSHAHTHTTRTHARAQVQARAHAHIHTRADNTRGARTHTHTHTHTHAHAHAHAHANVHTGGRARHLWLDVPAGRVSARGYGHAEGRGGGAPVNTSVGVRRDVRTCASQSVQSITRYARQTAYLLEEAHH